MFYRFEYMFNDSDYKYDEPGKGVVLCGGSHVVLPDDLISELGWKIER